MPWHAIECSEHAESFVSSELTALGLDVCLPRILKAIKMPRGKVAEILEPLFPGYVLAAWEPGYERGKVWRTAGVERVVGRVGDAFTPADLNAEVVNLLRANMDERGVLTCLDGEWMLPPRYDMPPLPPVPPDAPIRFPSQLLPGQTVTVDGHNLPALVEWHAGARVGVLLDMLGGKRAVTVKRVQVRAA
jgi:hypothetical protein